MSTTTFSADIAGLKVKFENACKRILIKAGNEISLMIKENFLNEGFFGQHWEEVKRRQPQTIIVKTKNGRKKKTIPCAKGAAGKRRIYNSHRPDYIVIDDIDDDQMCRNPRRVDEAVKWCLSALLGTMAMGRGRFVLVGNRIGQESVLTKMAERPHFFHTVVNALDENGEPSWKENYTKEEIAALREQMGELLFQKEYMNNPVIEGAVFEKRYIRYGKMLPLWKYRALVCYTDPSFKSSTKNDYKATVLAGLTPKGEYHVIKVFAAQTKISEMVAWHYEIRNYVGQGACKYYMEANFIQDTLLEEFRKAGEKLGIHIPVLGDRRKKPEK
ncbi:MAG: hypothetical protein K5685_04995 [Bacteroidales bacterium]|nr:hypothetical protein [Bacteroidales bacterium]